MSEFVVLVLGCWMAWAALPAAAQVNRAPLTASPQGTIEDIAPGVVKIATTGGESWMVRIPTRGADVLVTGSAHPDFLKPGLWVKFTADVTTRRKTPKVEGKVEKLTVFTPSEQDFPGVFPVGGFGGNQGPDAATPDADKKKGGEAQVSRCEIRGRITGVKNGKLAVTFNAGSVEIELADNAQIDLSVADYRLAKKGDKISCEGEQVGEKMIQARKVDIQLAEPVGGEQKTARQSRMPRKGDATDSPNEQEKTPAEGKDVSEELIAMLTPKADTPKADAPKVEESFRIEGDSAEFRPSVQGPAATLQKRFGKPERETVKGILVIKGKDRVVPAQVWTWGTVRVVVISSKTRFFAAGPGSEPKQKEPLKQEEQPKQEEPLKQEPPAEKPQ
jgi:hypothetical protein